MNLLPLSWLVCPVCKSHLIRKSNEYICKRCKKNYKIKDGIPVFLPYDSKKYKSINSVWKHHKSWIDFVTRAPRIRDFILLMDRNKKLFSGKILQIGSGSSALGSIIGINTSATVITTDISFNAIKLNIQTGEFIGKKSDFYAVCDSEKLPFADQLFDCVFGSSIIHHFETLRSIKDIYRVIKPGGYYIGISETACSKPFNSFYKRFSDFNIYENSGLPPKKIINFKRYEKIFHLTGFKEVEIQNCKNFLFHTYDFKSTIYYLLVSFLPDFIINNILCSEIHILARK